MNRELRITDILVAVYNSKGGQYAVYDFVETYFPDWKWDWCDPCQDTTPTYENICAVCFTERRIGGINLINGAVRIASILSEK